MSSDLRAITVFCGSSLGNDPCFEQAAKALGKCMADRGICLIYGGGNIGLMGAISNSVDSNGGKVTGVLPGFIKREYDPEKTVIVPDMHTRKRTMLDKADAFIALPGGSGTMEELMEMITWKELGLHKKPIGILNTAGFYDNFLEWVFHGVKCGFINTRKGSQYPFGIHVSDNPDEIINKLIESLPKEELKNQYFES